ncbi:MAG: penicillin-binding transpeptidase domain-containing protein [Peptococcaceae bacterium]|nr:penicillin-binding transpeptidase domain-containing protein [Peptococcaceae bacterium]
MQRTTTVIRKREAYLLILVLIAFLLLLLRYGWVQLVQGEQLREEALNIRSNDVLVEAKRGSIFDRNGNELVKSVSVDSAYAYPNLIKEPLKREAADKIAEALGMDNEEIYHKLTQDVGFVWLKRRIDYEASDKLKSLTIYDQESKRDYKVAQLLEEHKRFYMQDGMAAHLLGFVGDDNQGLTGFESVMDVELRGTPGRIVVERDAAGRSVPEATHTYIPSVPGQNIILTIDQTIQYFVERELDKIVQSYNPKMAVIIVMNPNTGEILAMGNRPTYSPADWQDYPKSVWNNNPAIWHNYEPGSTFKILVAAAALQEGTSNLGDYYSCPGFFRIADRTIRCWHGPGHGSQSFVKACQNSCNPGFITMGLRLGKDRFYEYINAFGLNSPTGINLPGEATGICISREAVTDLNIATMSIGQSIAVTPLQLTSAASAVANGGVLYQPFLVKAVTDGDGNVIQANEPQEVRRVISEDTSRIMMRLLTDVVLEGTGKSAYVEGYGAAGKTGTAQVVESGVYADGKYVASFVGFSPVPDPKITCLIVVSEPKGGRYYGSEVAAPVFSTLASDILRYMKIPEHLESQRTVQPRNEPPELIRVPNVLFYPVEDAERVLTMAGFRVNTGESGRLVTSQHPVGGDMVPGNTVVVLETADDDQSDELIMPDLYGMTIKEAGALLEKIGLALRPSGTGFAAVQSYSPGTEVLKGVTVEVEFRDR